MTFIGRVSSLLVVTSEASESGDLLLNMDMALSEFESEEDWPQSPFNEYLQDWTKANVFNAFKKGNQLDPSN